MLIERQVSIFCAGMSVALTLPACAPVYKHQATPTGGSLALLLLGTLLGALGVLMGILLAADEFQGASRSLQRLWPFTKLVFWVVCALALSAGTGLVAFHTPGAVWRSVLGIVSLAPVAGLALALSGYRK